MRYTVSNDAQVQLTVEKDTSRSHHIVKLTPRVCVKKMRQVRIPKRATRISVNPMPHCDEVKKETRRARAYDASLSEIIALLEQARSRSRNSIENTEVNSTLTPKLSIPHSSPRGQVSYH
jgi:hypothetical protein